MTEDITGPTNNVAIAPPCTCGKGHAVETGNHTLAAAPVSAENGDPSAAATSTEAEEATGGQGKAMGNNSSVAAVKPSDANAAAGKGLGNNSSDITLSDDAGKTQGSSVNGSAPIKPEGSSSPIRFIASKTLALARDALARFTSLAMRVSGTVSNRLTLARAAFVLFTLLALWYSADQPQRAVWTFSVIAISYLALWTIWLTAAIRARTVLVSVSYVALVGISITHLSSTVGIFVILLDSAYAAGLCGYALSEYRQRKGFELAVEVLHTHNKEELKDDRAVIAMVSFYSTIASMVCAAGAAWVIYYIVDTYWLIVVLSLLMDLSLFCWTALVAVHLLHGALLADEHIAFIYWGTVLLLVPDLLLSYLFGNAIGMLVHPLGAMGIAGLLGYNLGLYVRYKKILEGDNGKNKKVA